MKRAFFTGKWRVLPLSYFLIIASIIQTHAQPSWINACEFTEDSRYVIQAIDKTRVEILDIANEKILAISDADKFGVTDLVVVGNDIFYTTGREGIVRKWNINGELLKSYGRTRQSLNSLVVDTANSRLITGGGDGVIYIWDIDTGRLIKDFAAHSAGIISSFISGNLLITSGFDGKLVETDLSTGANKVLYSDKDLNLYDLNRVDPNYLFCSTISYKGKEEAYGLLLFDLSKRKVMKQIEIEDPIDQLHLDAYDFRTACYKTTLGLHRYSSTNNKFIFHDPTVIIEVTPKGKIKGEEEKTGLRYFSEWFSQFSPNNKFMKTGEFIVQTDLPEGEEQPWYFAYGKADSTLTPAKPEVSLITTKLKSQSLNLQALRANSAQLDDIIEPIVQNGFPKIYQAILSADSSKIAVSNESNLIKIFDVSRKKLVFNIKSNSPVVRLVAHPNAPVFASLTTNGEIDIWDFETFKLLKTFQYIDKEKFSSWFKKEYDFDHAPAPLDVLRYGSEGGGYSEYDDTFFSFSSGDNILRIFTPSSGYKEVNFNAVNINDGSAQKENFELLFEKDIPYDIMGDKAYKINHDDCPYMDESSLRNNFSKAPGEKSPAETIYEDIVSTMEYVVPAVHTSNYGLEIVFDYGKAIHSIDIQTLKNTNIQLNTLSNEFNKYTSTIEFKKDDLIVPKTDKHNTYFEITRYIDTVYAKVVDYDGYWRIYGPSEIRNSDKFYFDRYSVSDVEQLYSKEYYEWNVKADQVNQIARDEYKELTRGIGRDEDEWTWQYFDQYGLDQLSEEEPECENMKESSGYLGEDYITEGEMLSRNSDLFRGVSVNNILGRFTAVAKDCQYISSILPTNGITIENTNKREKATSIPAQTSRVIYQEFLDKSGYFMTNNTNGEIQLWNYKDGSPEKPVVSFLGSKDELFVMTPDFYYAALTKNAHNIAFRKGDLVFGFEQFDLRYNRPDIVLDRLGFADSTLVRAYHEAYLKRLKKMGFTEDMLKDDFHLPKIKIENFEYLPSLTDSASIGLNLKLNDSKYKLDRINVWVNDVAIYGTDGISLRDKDINTYSTTLPVYLAKGKNKIQVSVLNQAGAESYKETVEMESTAGKDKPDLYLITIGESEFSESSYNLKYAAKDAHDVVELLKKSTVYGNVYSKTLVNKDVTRKNILELQSFIDQAGINDEVLFFIAGHGVLDNKLDYYFATYDMDFNNPAERGMAYEDIEGLLNGIKPIKKMLFIDACHSGEIDKEEVELMTQNTTKVGGIQFRAVGNAVKAKLGVQNTSELTRSLFTDLRKGTGATVISSAGGMEFAMEGEDWNNGLFTYSLIHGIESKEADLNQDGEVWLSELKQYVSEQVSKLSNGKQQPTSRIENQALDYRVW